MRSILYAIVLFSFSVLSSAQIRFAGNPACTDPNPQNAPFCRVALQVAGTPLVAMGFHNGLLYGYVPVSSGTSCPTSGLPANSVPTLCFYQTSSFAPEHWVFQGKIAQNLRQQTIEGNNQTLLEYPVEIVFGPGSCSSWKYIYTTLARILRATSSPGDWDFHDVGSTQLPNLPPDTTGRQGSFAAVDQGSRTRLFYGNYNDHTYNGMNPPYGAYVWHSDDCGTTWTTQTSPAPNLGGREVHAINVDPTNSSTIYVTVDSEASQQLNPRIFPAAGSLGLWRSTDGGSTFSLLTPSSNAVGIDFVFPTGPNKLFLETDGCAGFPKDSQDACPNRPSGSGPLLLWDGVSSEFEVAAQWPIVPGEPPWAGSANYIKLTSEQNIFLLSNGEPPTGFSNRFGFWYFLAPNYDTALLVEDLAPPIQSVSMDNQKATATTFAPHGLTPGERLTISGVTTPCFNGDVTVMTTDPANNRFTYASGCAPNTNGTGGFASKLTLQEIIVTLARTVEVTDPNTNFTYLYSGNQRMVKPRPYNLISIEPVTTILLNPQ
jgi:hypothetical protein